MKSKGGWQTTMHKGFVSGNKNGGGAVRLGLRFFAQNCQYFKTLVFFEMLQYHRKVLQLGWKPVTIIVKLLFFFKMLQYRRKLIQLESNQVICEQGVNEFIQHLNELRVFCNEKKGCWDKWGQVKVPIRFQWLRINPFVQPSGYTIHIICDCKTITQLC